MGKRELLLIVGFLIVGAAIYQATAPPADPDGHGFSFGRLIEAARREISGNRALAETTATGTHALGPEIAEVRIIGMLADLEITGEDRADIQTALRVSSRAYNDEEAKQFASETQVLVDPAGPSLTFRVKYPEGGRQRATLSLRIPARLKVRVEAAPGNMTITHVASVETGMSRGEAKVTDIGGRVTMQRFGGAVAIERVESLQFTGRAAELTVKEVRGDTSIRLEPGGELNATGLRGAVDVDARNADLVLPALAGTRGPIRININGGSAKVHGIKADTRIDARNGELDVIAGGGAPVTIYHDGEDVALTLPPGGYRLDALVTGGGITAADGLALEQLGLSLTSSESPPEEARAAGTVKGGGPTITVRGTRGDLTLRGPAQ